MLTIDVQQLGIWLNMAVGWLIGATALVLLIVVLLEKFDSPSRRNPPKPQEDEQNER